MDFKDQNPINKYKQKRSIYDIDNFEENLFERKRLNIKEITKDKTNLASTFQRPINKMDIDVTFSNKISTSKDQSKARLQNLINDKKKYMNQNKVIEEGTQYYDCCN